MQFAQDQILNPSHKKGSPQRKKMNQPLLHCFQSSRLYNSAVLRYQIGQVLQNILVLTIIFGALPGLGKHSGPPGF